MPINYLCLAHAAFNEAPDNDRITLSSFILMGITPKFWQLQFAVMPLLPVHALLLAFTQFYRSTILMIFFCMSN